MSGYKSFAKYMYCKYFLQVVACLFISFLFIYLLIYLVALGLSCSKWAPYLGFEGSLVVADGLLSCSMHVGSSSQTSDRTWAPCIGSVES